MNRPPAPAAMDAIAPLREFVVAATRLADQSLEEAARVAAMKPLLARLIATDGWLPEDAAQPHPEYYCQYLLHCDPLERFSVVSFVWGPGQRTPIHDHTVWGLIGMLRGAETGQHYRHAPDGRLAPHGAPARLEPGDIELVSPATGDIHQVANAHADRTSISIHVYGANIGAVARHVFDAQTGMAKSFVSGYSSTAVPNLWDRSEAMRRSLGEAAP
ncbi:cysteine dioxygenase [Variovorax terrae]|uniref:Cysteine dioxygenase n=1 Tax=Variovorax terrae TaxID=2923278 RepID=A0A9X1VRN2_9BURK|nr:cysteine dioxygenase [Variovorax terrae]MCJ0762571.1 cysteine dioxygenase [Variovorax terrae]